MYVSAALIASVVLATTPTLTAAAGKWECKSQNSNISSLLNVSHTPIVYAYEGLNGMMSYGRLDPIIAPGAV